MSKSLADLIARSFQTFLTDYEIPNLVDCASERGVMVKTVNTTITKRPDEKFSVTVWDKGDREIHEFDESWDALFFVREIEAAR